MKRGKSNDRQASLVRALLHGDSGAGKTTSILTLPVDKTLVAISERGALPLRKKDFEVAWLESWQDCRELIGEMQKANGEGPKILVIDSLTDCSELCKSHIVRVDRRQLISERTSGAKDKPVGVYDDLMTMEDWNLYSSRMNGFLGAACRLPMHVIFTALSVRKENKKTGEQMKVPDVNGQLAFECPCYFDLVMHMESMETTAEDGTKVAQRVWRTEYNGEIICKDASGALSKLETTNWTGVFKKILADNGSAGEKAKRTTKEKKEPENVSV